MAPEPNDEGEFGLVMPFVVCEDQGGPFESGAFVAGWLCGRTDAQLQAAKGTHTTVKFWADPAVVPQLDLIAMHHELALTSEPWDEHPDEWAAVTIGPASGEEDTHG